jgi:hypothetical protein
MLMGDAVLDQHAGKTIVGKLRTLVGIEDCWYAVVLDSLF